MALVAAEAIGKASDKTEAADEVNVVSEAAKKARVEDEAAAEMACDSFLLPRYFYLKKFSLPGLLPFSKKALVIF